MVAHGAVVAHSEGDGVWDSTTTWRVAEDLRIGSAADEGPTGFNEIVGLTVDPAKRIYVVERTTQEIRVFDSTGTFLRRMGRKGRGPGEMQDVSGIDWDRAGRLWIVDPGNGRYTLFDTSGHFVATRPRATPFNMFPWNGAFLASGDLVDVFGLPGAGLPPPLGLVRFDTALVARDTLPLPASDPPRFTLRRVSGNNVSMMSAPVPFAASVHWRLDRRGFLWLGATVPYRVYRLRLTGDTAAVVERSYVPLRVSGSERATALARLDWFVKQGGPVDASRIPSEKPAFEDFFVDDDGRLWVNPVTAAGDSASARVFDVFDADGRLLGRLQLPWKVSSWPPPVFRGDRLYAVTADPDGVPFVVRAHIERGSRLR